jgi:hypothetical protein
MKTFTIGYAIHNKDKLIPKIIEGLSKNIPNTGINYIFIFDGCTDKSYKVFYENVYKLNGTFQDFTTGNIFELNTNNMMISKFTTDFLIIFQDDMILKDRTLLNHIEGLDFIYKDKLGVIGCRDGFDVGYTNMFSSPFSGSPNSGILKHGDYREVMMVNRGPIVFNQTIKTKVGILGTEFNKSGAYSEMDYCLRCYYEGFKNIILSTEIDHIRKQNPIFSTMDEESHVVFSNKWKDKVNI